MINYDDSIRWYYDIACMYEKHYNTDFEYPEYAFSVPEKFVRSKIPTSVLEGAASEYETDVTVQEITRDAKLDEAKCEKIKTSRGFRQTILTEFHDACITDARMINNGCDLEITFGLDSCVVQNDVCYCQKVSVTFENVKELNSARLQNIVGLYVSRDEQTVVENKMSFSFDLWNDKTSEINEFHVYCNEVNVKRFLIKD